MQQSNNNIPWVEKYRPTNFENIVLDKLNRQIFTNILENEYFPNLLFYGPPGTGKTTTIINLINEYNKKYTTNSKGSVIHLNASDERGIDIIRNQILQFVRTNNFFENCTKVQNILLNFSKGEVCALYRDTACFGKVYRTIFLSKRRRLVFKTGVIMQCTFRTILTRKYF